MIWARNERFREPNPADSFNSFSEYLQLEYQKSLNTKNKAAQYKSLNGWVEQSMLHDSIKKSPDFQRSLQETMGIDWEDKGILLVGSFY